MQYRTLLFLFILLTEALYAQDAPSGPPALSGYQHANCVTQHYLDGRRDDRQEVLAHACKAGSGGFYGLHLLLEPSIGRLNFSKSLPYWDTWMGGAYAGLDFSPCIGFRGFYLKAINDGRIKLDFDNLTLYGGEWRLRPDLAWQIRPTILLGGGYLHVNGRYLAREAVRAKDQFFAQTGMGLTLPLSDRFQFMAGARAVLTAGSGVKGHQAPNGLHTSWMYNLSCRIYLVKKVKTPTCP